MTNEEAKKRLKVLTDYEYDKDLEALNMAIEALEKEDVLDKIRAEIDGLLNDEDNHTYTHGVMDCLEILDKYKAEREEEPKTGEWIFTTEGNTDHITCSICGRDSMGTFDYCPNCGAKMEGDIKYEYNN